MRLQVHDLHDTEMDTQSLDARGEMCLLLGDTARWRGARVGSTASVERGYG